MTDEPQITINGRVLNPAEAMVVRAVCASMETEVSDRDAFGDDVTGRLLARIYLQNLRSVLKAMNAPMMAGGEGVAMTKDPETGLLAIDLRTMRQAAMQDAPTKNANMAAPAPRLSPVSERILRNFLSESRRQLVAQEASAAVVVAKVEERKKSNAALEADLAAFGEPTPKGFGPSDLPYPT